MRKHLILTAVGLIVGLIALAWVQPNTSPGATFLVVLSILLVNALGAIIWRRSGASDEPDPPDKPLALIPFALASILAMAQPAAAREVGAICGKPPVISDLPLKTSLDGEIANLSGRAGEPGLFAAIESANKDLLAKYPGDRLEQLNAYIVYGLCTHIQSDRSLGMAQRLSTIDNLQKNLIVSAMLETPASADRAAPTKAALELSRSLKIFLVPTRAYIGAADIPPKGVGAYGVVALRAKPTDSSRKRLLMACHAFTASLPRQDSLPPSVGIGEQMVTVWPLTKPNAPEAGHDDCNFLVDNYDLYGGIAAIRDAESQKARLDGPGPFLIGWSPSASRTVPDALVFVIDMSSFDSQDSFDQAFLFWQKKVVEEPALWHHGFSVEGTRLAIRDFVDHYGQDMLDAVKIWGAKD